jgi:tetratricopeptide (TPR) repeat protein
MKTLLATILLSVLLLSFGSTSTAQDETARVIWQVRSFDINANLQEAERSLNATATLNATNVGTIGGTTFTVRLNSKASVKTVAVAGTSAIFRSVPERGELQRVTVTLPTSVAPNTALSLTFNYAFPVESNTGLAAISPLSSQFLPLSFWYPTPNTPYTVLGADTAPFHVTVNASNVISSGVEKAGPAGSSTFEQTLSGQPFFVQGDWDKVEGTGDGKGIVVLLSKGVSADERKQAEALIGVASAARTYFAAVLGPAPEVAIRLVSVKSGAGFSDTGTVLIEPETLRRPKLDAATALTVAEAIARFWIGGQTPIRGQGNGVVRDGLVRFLATLFLEKQFGRDAAQSELLRERLAYTAVAKRDGPLSKATQLDTTYFGSVPNRGAMVWRLVARRLGQDNFMSTLRGLLQTAKNNPNGVSLAALRSALVDRGGDSLKLLVDQQLDQVIDTDLLIGVPQQRNGEWVSALRNLGSIDVSVPVVATTDRGEQVVAEAIVPARNFGEAVFKTAARIVRVELDPEKLYPQVDYSNDAAPRTRDLPEALADASRQLGAQDYVKAETTSRELFAAAPRLQEAQILLARALIGQNKVDEAEKLFRAALDQALPAAATVAWANIGLGEISLKRGQAAEAAKHFSDAVHASRDYASSLVSRAERIRAEAAANNAPPIDESARAFISQLDQAIVSGKKGELDSRIVSGELVKFVRGIVGTQPEIWETHVLRTEQLNAGLMAVDVSIRARQLGKDGSGTALLVLMRAPGGWKLSAIDLFEVR